MYSKFILHDPESVTQKNILTSPALSGDIRPGYRTSRTGIDREHRDVRRSSKTGVREQCYPRIATSRIPIIMMTPPASLCAIPFS